LGARPYDPSLGRFLEVDPVEGGSLNNYDYVGQDTVNGYDLSGRRPEVDNPMDFLLWYPNAGSSDALVTIGPGGLLSDNWTTRKKVIVKPAKRLINECVYARYEWERQRVAKTKNLWAQVKIEKHGNGKIDYGVCGPASYIAGIGWVTSIASNVFGALYCPATAR
jgi:hypothetical protein